MLQFILYKVLSRLVIMALMIVSRMWKEKLFLFFLCIHLLILSFQDIWKRNQTYSFSLEAEKQRNNVSETDDCVMVSFSLKEKSKKIIEKAQSVVTFEILDDDDENGDTNYMVYMHREVQSKRYLKKSNHQAILPVVTISSDSEDDTSSNNVEKNYCSESLHTKGLRASCKNINLPIVARQHDNQKTNSIDFIKRIDNCPSYEKCDEEPERIFGLNKDPVLPQNSGEIENLQEDSDLLVIQYNENLFEELDSTIDPTLLFKEPGRENVTKFGYDYVRSSSPLFNDNLNSSDTCEYYYY